MSQLKCDVPSPHHYDYDELEAADTACECTLCQKYRASFEAYDECKANCRGHDRTCKCYVCRTRDEVQITYMAALSQRDTFSELSYLTVCRGQKPLAPVFLGWIYARMIDPGYHTEAWWAVKAPSRSLAEWMWEWQEKCLPREVWEVSGVY